MKKITILTLLILTGLYLSAQVTEKENDLKKVSTDTINGWKKGGMITFTFGQSSFTNWASGGINNISVNGLAGLFANYKKDNLTWGNNLDIGYGLQVLGTGDAKNTQKTDDRFDFSSKLGLKAADKLYYAALMNFKTQFTNGYAYPNDSVAISGFMAPGYLLFAAGIDYRPTGALSVFIAPLTSKNTFVNNQDLADAGAYGVDPGKNVRSEFGGYLKAVYTKDIMKNVNLNTKLGLFSNYLHNPQNIDVDWEVLLGMKINKYITANISTQLLYDDDIMVPLENGGTGKRVQFKEILGIGFSMKF